MAIKALDLKPISYVSKLDTDENPTEWSIRGLTRLEWLEVENNMQSSSIQMDGEDIRQVTNSTNNGTTHKLVLDFGLVEWKGFYDPDGETVPFNDNNKERIPREVRDELVSEIVELTSIDKTLEKN